MTAPKLFQADDTVFVDIYALNFCRFDHNGETTANLKFDDGSSEIISGLAARNLFERIRNTPATVELEPLPTTTIPSPPQPPPITSISSSAPLGRNKIWAYRKDPTTGRGLILALVNAKGSCSVRPFDAKTASALGVQTKRGFYQIQFADLLEGAVELIVETQPSLARDCKQKLPADVFAYFRKQIDAIEGSK